MFLEHTLLFCLFRFILPPRLRVSLEDVSVYVVEKNCEERREDSGHWRCSRVLSSVTGRQEDTQRLLTQRETETVYQPENNGLWVSARHGRGLYSGWRELLRFSTALFFFVPSTGGRWYSNLNRFETVSLFRLLEDFLHKCSLRVHLQGLVFL